MTGTAAYCGHCGREIGSDPADARGDEHAACRRRLEMEPPRYCARCARRMKVQVTPTGWSAECVAHGVLSR